MKNKQINIICYSWSTLWILEIFITKGNDGTTCIANYVENIFNTVSALENVDFNADLM